MTDSTTVNLTSDRQTGRALFGAIIFLTLWTFLHSYPVDDAYISFRYAGNLVAGNGLVWNVGEQVEGYTNFLWTLFIAAGMKLGATPEATTTLLNIPLFVALLWLTYRIALRINRTAWVALAALIIAGLNHSIWAFARSGMETILITTLFLAVVEVVESSAEKGWNEIRTLTLGLLVCAAMLTRPDAGLLALWCIWAYFRTSRSANGGFAFRWREIATFAAPLLILLLPYAIWKLNFYGSLFPNSFRVKVQALSGVSFGIYYLYLFILAHLLLPHLVLLAAVWKKMSAAAPSAGRIGWLVVIWLLYSIYAGGDFMEFRFLAPVIPLLITLLTFVSVRFVPLKPAGIALLLALLLGTIHGWFSLNRFLLSYGLETTTELRNHLHHPNENWVGIGKQLGELFANTGVKISAGAAGAIPFYSNLETIDFIGLTDPEIPRIGLPFTRVPGHRLIAPVEYLYARNINLFIEPNNFMFTRTDFNNWARSANWNHLQRLYINLDRPGIQITEVVMLGIPIGPDHVLAVWYMTPHPEVDRIAREQGFRWVRITRW